jgi:TonB-dependent receptor
MRSLLYVLTWSAMIPALTVAQTTGEVRGSVTDTSGRVVPGAVLQLSGTRYAARVDSSGRYRIAGIPVGTYVLRVARIGFATDSESLTVSTSTITKDFSLRPAVEVLGSVVVNAQRLGETQAAALNRRESASNFVVVLAGDAIRALPTLNAAEAAGRLPGVTTERDEGEGKFVQIRGAEPRLANVTINGAHVPGTEKARIPKLDDVPSDILGAIEVSKTLTAEMDADAIAGSVNLVTKTPEGAPSGYVAGQYGQMSLLNRSQYQGGFAYGGRYGAAQRLGFLIGGSADRNNRAISDLEPAWGVDANNRSFPNDWSQRSYVYGRNRYGLGADLDYRFQDGSTLFLKGLASRFENFGTTYVDDVASGATNSTFGDTGDSSAVGARGFGTGVEVTREAYIRTPVEHMWGFTTGGSTTWGNFTVKATGTLAGTSQTENDYRFSPFVYDGPGGQGLTVSYDASNPKVPTFQFVNTAMAQAAANPANFLLQHYFTVDHRTSGRDLGAGLDLSTPWRLSDASWTSTLRFGGKLRDETKSFRQTGGFWSTSSPFSMDLAGTPYTDASYYQDISNAFTFGPAPNADGASAYENAHATAFQNGTNAVGNTLNSFDGSERIAAAYVSNTMDVGLLSLYLGLRAENTHASYNGHVVKRDTTGRVTSVTSTPGSQTYTDLFPNAQLKYTLEDGTVVRLSVSRGISRPNYFDLAPHLSGTIGGNKSNPGNLSSGNPELKPQHAWNYDLLAEHYFPSVGVLSGGVFYKSITDFILAQRFVYNGPVTEFNGQAGTRPQNGGSGHILGFEGEYQQRLVFLPGEFAGLGVDLNVTHTESRALVDPSAGRYAPMSRTSPTLANVALTYDLGRLSARAAWAYQGANIVSYGDGTTTANGDTYFYAHSQIDASLLYSFTKQIQLQVQGLDLNNAVFGFFSGTPGHDYSIQREYYERTVYVGMKYGF